MEMRFREIIVFLLLVCLLSVEGAEKKAMNDLTSCRGGMLQHYYMKKFQAADQKRFRRISRIKNKADAEIYSAEIRRKLKHCFGPLPPVKVIDPQITGKLETPKLVIEKVVFASRPGFCIPALFYYPKNHSGKLPGILHLCGHTGTGKFGRTYQKVCQSLALRGFGVLCPDPFGQGERCELGGGPGNEHDIFGLHLGLTGDFFGTWRLHDALTSLEYLKSRPEIHGGKIGVTGCSGGGTLTSYVNAFSDIPMMAAPICSITRMTRNLENEIYTDCEQMIPHFKEAGLEETDFFLARAPRPCYMGIQDNDFFDCSASKEIGAEIRRFYGFFGAEKNFVLKEGRGDHGYPEFHWTAVGEFFSALTDSHPVGTDSDIVVFPDEQLFCAPGGNVKNMRDFRSAAVILREMSKSVKSETDLAGLKKYLGIGPAEVPEYRNGFQQYFDPAPLHASRFLLRSEPGIEVALKKIAPAVLCKLEFTPEINLFLPEKTGLPEFIKMRGTSRLDAGGFWLLEMRGVGETLSCPPDSDLMMIYPRLYASCGTVLGRPLLGGQVQDLLSCLALMKAHGVRKINLTASGFSCIPALLASFWSPLPLVINLIDPPESWRDCMRHPEISMPHESLPFGILKYADLPQILEACRGKGHTIKQVKSLKKRVVRQ